MMSETLIGVIVGGVIASTIPTITLYIEYKKWKKEKRIEHLRLQRDKLERTFHEAFDKLTQGLVENSYPIHMLSDFECLFPEKVSKEFKLLMSLPKKSDEEILKVKFQLSHLSHAMKEVLLDIDREIEKEINE